VIQLPLIWGIIIGGVERYGLVDDSGAFVEVTDPRAEIGLPVVNLLPLAGSFALELPCVAEILDPDGSVGATVEIGAVEGRPACVRIEAAPGRELTGELLRRVPLAQLVREATAFRIVTVRDGFAVRHIGPSSPVEIAETRRRRILGSEFLRDIADTYRLALVSGVPPATLIQEKFGPTTPENARRWVMAARKAGFLASAPGPGKAGEIKS
jgi:hypothetical protein